MLENAQENVPSVDKTEGFSYTLNISKNNEIQINIMLKVGQDEKIVKSYCAVII